VSGTNTLSLVRKASFIEEEGSITLAERIELPCGRNACEPKAL
jgi:hypothetical protein